ncbi:hypothetical protein [Cecembia calidifontis]|uniref:Uncharacterized protein n=1 Tax=Cecembia calidifontis TaxID=1187080 RepID=A0A4Q7P827_9BACT|nr:hypothetical protein [Cecembia calidifontis]RZS96303.1 hypothetical protein BC751_1871 [Cecembia calidifontis]
MERLDMEKMENLVGGSDYCDTAWLLLSGGGFQGSDELYLILAESYIILPICWTKSISCYLKSAGRI